ASVDAVKAEHEEYRSILEFESSIKPHESQVAAPAQEAHNRPATKPGTDILPVETNEKHQAIVRVFKHKAIPVIEGTQEGISDTELPLKTVQTIMTFLRDFEEYYKAFLTKNLLDDLAWRYMIAALNPSELNLQYKKDIRKIEEKNRT
ncbi:hypothetical protein BGX31_004436, partial [Mortierella sp. GBA43]